MRSTEKAERGTQHQHERYRIETLFFFAAYQLVQQNGARKRAQVSRELEQTEG